MGDNSGEDTVKRINSLTVEILDSMAEKDPDTLVKALAQATAIVMTRQVVSKVMDRDMAGTVLMGGITKMSLLMAVSVSEELDKRFR